MSVRALVAFVVAGTATFVVGPRLLFRLAGAAVPRRAPALPWLAVALFVLAWYLPNPDLATTDSSQGGTARAA